MTNLLMSSSVPSGELLNLTRAMMLAAEAGDWRKVGEIEVRRQIVIKEIAEVIGAKGDKVPFHDMDKHMREVLALNKRMTALGESEKADLAKAMAGLSQGRKAVSAYYGVR